MEQLTAHVAFPFGQASVTSLTRLKARYGQGHRVPRCNYPNEPSLQVILG